MKCKSSLFTYFFLAITLLGCSADKTVYGAIDESLIITDEEIHEMGIDEFKKNYEGKEVTITGLRMMDRSGLFDSRKGQCAIGYINSDNNLPIAASIYTNFIPPNAINRSNDFDKTNYIYAQEIELPLSICAPCEKDHAGDLCKNQPNETRITGKIMLIIKTGKRIYMYMKIRGMSY
ncbi:MAG: hypothetical protein V7765_19710 [Oleispira sp.]